VGLFGRTAATICNLIIDGVKINAPNATYVGAISGDNAGTIQNCIIKNVSISANNLVGGIAGRNLTTGKIMNCINLGDEIKSKEEKTTSQGTGDIVQGTGGIVGENNGFISNCINFSDVYGYEIVGGIVGRHDIEKTEQIMNCLNYGSVFGYQDIGGIIGMLTNVKLTYNTYKTSLINIGNYGDIFINSKTNANDSRAGAIVGLYTGDYNENGEMIILKDISNGGTVYDKNENKVNGNECDFWIRNENDTFKIISHNEQEGVYSGKFSFEPLEELIFEDYNAIACLNTPDDYIYSVPYTIRNSVSGRKIVNITGKSNIFEDYYKVNANEYIEITNMNKIWEIESVSKTVYCIVEDGMNVRDFPGVTYGKDIGDLGYGKSATVTAICTNGNNKWYQIEFNGKVGYIGGGSQYVSEEKPPELSSGGTDGDTQEPEEEIPEQDTTAPTVIIRPYIEGGYWQMPQDNITNEKEIFYELEWSEEIKEFNSENIEVLVDNQLNADAKIIYMPEGGITTEPLIIVDYTNCVTGKKDVTLRLPAGIAKDNNDNLSVQQESTCTIDLVAPKVDNVIIKKNNSEILNESDTYVISGDELEITVEIKKGLEQPILPIKLGFGVQNSEIILNNSDETIDNKIFKYYYIIKPEDEGRLELIVQETYKEYYRTDSVGNILNTEYDGDIPTIIADNTAPTVEISSDPNEPKNPPTNADEITYTFKWSEEVTGFDLNDITVHNAEPGSLEKTGKENEYTLKVTPHITKGNEGEVRVIVEADACHDLVGHGNIRKEISTIIDKKSPELQDISITYSEEDRKVNGVITFNENLGKILKGDVELYLDDTFITSEKFTEETSTDDNISENKINAEYIIPHHYGGEKIRCVIKDLEVQDKLGNILTINETKEIDVEIKQVGIEVDEKLYCFAIKRSNEEQTPISYSEKNYLKEGEFLWVYEII